MKKVSDSLKAEYSMLRLYKTDLVEISETINLLSKESTWTTDKYSYDSFKEFVSNNNEKELRQLKIRSYQPSVIIDLYRHSGELTVYSDEISHEGLYNRLNKILFKRQLKVSFLFNGRIFWSLLLLLLIINLLFKIPNRISELIYGVLIFIQGIGGYLSLTRNSIILMYNRDEEKNFWTRNKDQIILLLLGAILGSVLTMIVDYLKHRVEN
jgi:hypothetical protein